MTPPAIALVLLLLPLQCRSATVTIERSAVPNSFFQFQFDTDEMLERCEYAGEILVSHPMSVEQEDKYYDFGSNMLAAAHISLNAINMWPRCGVHLDAGNYSLRLRTYGDNSSTNMTETIGHAIVHDNHTNFMLAGYSSTLTEFLAPIAQDNDRLLLTAGSSSTDIHANKSMVFGLLPPSDRALENAFRGLAAKGAKSVAYITEEGVKSCLDAPNVAAQFNMTFINATTVPELASHQIYREAAENFAQLQPDVLVNCIRTNFAAWNQALRNTMWSPAANIYAIVVGTVEFEEALGDDLPYVMGISSWDPALPPVPDGASGWTPAQFDQEFEKAAFRPPAYQHASQSAAVSVLVQAIERVGDYKDQVAVQKVIAKEYFPTVYGNISFDVNGQSTAPNLLLQYDANGTLHVLLPTSLVSTDFEMVYPQPGYLYRDCEVLSSCAGTNGTCTFDGTCDCQFSEAVSQGQGATAECIIPPEPPTNYTTLIIGIVLGLVVLAAFAMYIHHRNKGKYDDTAWQISRNDLLVDDPPNVIGQGNFGVVFMAEYRGTQVAVKRVIPAATGNPMWGRTSLTGNHGRTAVTVMEQARAEEDIFMNEVCDETKYQQRSGMRSLVSAHRSLISAKGTHQAGSSMSGSFQNKMKKDFIVEMRFLNALRHPTIITVLGAVMDAEDPMLVMEYMQHGSFHSMLHNKTMFLDDEILLPILRDVSSGCRFLHAANPPCIHGDLKAANILVDDKMRAKVADFGLASVRKRAGASGTPFWMAPELLRGDNLNTKASDIYSFGMILWEAFSRQHPYEGEGGTGAILAQIADPKINKRPPTPKDCPAQIDSLMKDCLSASPEDRPSFEEIDSRLKRVEPRTQKDDKGNVSLYDIFPRHIADALRSGQKVEPEHKESVTIFFSDIVNYTSITSEMDPRKVAGMLDRLYHKFDDLSHKHDIFKLETIGDAYVAVTNLVKDQEDDHAVRIASFAIDAIKAANQTMIDPEQPARGCLNIRCGFHSGPVVADVVGSRNPRYCLFGESVNTASRMESNSEKNRILCSQASATLLEEQNCPFTVDSRGKIKPKGLREMAVYWVGDEITQQESAPFVGDEITQQESAPAESARIVVEKIAQTESDNGEIVWV